MIKANHFQQAHIKGRQAALDFKINNLNFNSGSSSSNFLSKASGSSIEYSDHREYSPGDDPRYLDWKAYARTDSLIMKEFQKEIAPYYEIVLDFSPSMFFTEEKKLKSLELLYFNIELALQAKLLPRIYFISGDSLISLSNEELFFYKDFDWEEKLNARPDLNKIKFKAYSLRIFISDLLYLGEPRLLLIPLIKNSTATMIFSPYLKEENSPNFLGVVKFKDCETAGELEIKITEKTLLDYKRVYSEHFSFWEEQVLKYSSTLIKLDCADEITNSLISQNTGFLYQWK